MLLRRLTYPLTTGLILRRTYPDLYKSHIIKLFDEFPQTVEWFNFANKELRLPNGSRLFFGSAEGPQDLSAFYSAEFADIMIDEAQEFSQGEIEQLSGSNRCTSSTAITPKMVMTFMPGVGETGIPPKGLSYLKRVFVDNQLMPEELRHKWQFIQAHSWDNIEWARKSLEADGVSEDEFYSWDEAKRRDYFIDRTEFGAVLSSLTNKALRDAWLNGLWGFFEGMYYTNFDANVGGKHVISRLDVLKRLKPWHKRWISGDWGFDHPHAVYWHAQDERGHVLTYREQWGREVGEAELGRLITEKSAGETLHKGFPFSWDAGKQSPRSNRELPKSIVQLLTEALGPNMPKPFPASSSPGSRIARARLTHQLLDSGIWQISEDCTHLRECLPSLMRDPDNTEDVLKVDWTENKIGDDPYDAVSMGLEFMLGATSIPRDVQLEDKLSKIRQQYAGSGETVVVGDPFAAFGGKRFGHA